MKNKSFTLKEIASLTKSTLVGQEHHTINNVSDLDSATAHDVSFLSNPRYRQNMLKSKAGVIFIDEQTTKEDGRNYLVTANPSQAFQTVVDLFYPQRKNPSGFSGIHPTAVIHETAKLGEGVTIGPYAVIDAGATVGSNSYIGAHVYIGPDTSVGSDCKIYPHVSIREECVIGNRVIIQSGAVIGSCGFGFITTKEGKHQKLNQVGNVEIGDDVEIGANTTIDRSRFKSTKIGKGTKVDNLVQIAHGVELGEDNLIVSQVGISGSSSTGKNVVLGGQVGVVGHVHLSDGVMVAAQSGVSKSLEAGTYLGTPAMPIDKFKRREVYLRNIQKYVEQIKALHQKEV